MADSALLNFTVKSISASLAEIEIKNTSGAVINQPLDIQFTFSSDPGSAVISSRLLAAKDSALISETPPNMASVAGIASVDRGLSIWVLYDPKPVLILKIVNNFDQRTGAELPAPVALDAGSVIALKIPLMEKISSSQVNVAYKYKLGKGRGQYITGSLLLKVEDTGKWEPQVSLSVDRENSTMLEPGELVKISWSVKDGVSATLLGPLPGGHSKRTLSNEAGSDFRIDKGSMEVYAVGQATYFLDARVRKPEKKDIEKKDTEEEKIQVVRTLFLDTKQVDKFAFMRVRPDRILPNGHAAVHWAVWGVKKATVRIGEQSLALSLTERDLSGYYQGSGIWSERVSKHEEVTLKIDDFKLLEDKVRVENWKAVKLAHGPTGKPVGLAVAAPSMALLTSDGLWIANVGIDDKARHPLTLECRKVATDTPKAWLAVTAFEKGFVVLRQVAISGRLRPMDVFQLARYDLDGKLQGLPLDMQGSPPYLVGQPGLVCDLVGFGNRVYVVVDRPLFRGSARYALSARFDAKRPLLGESLLSRLHGYRLLSLADGLYALNPGSGQMLRFGLPKGDAELREAYKAAPAAKNGRSLIRSGLPASAGAVLAVLDPDNPPASDSSALSGLSNVFDFILRGVAPARAESQPPEDLVYNPQKNNWIACGQGLKTQRGAVTAFRGGDSKRLWLLQADGKMHTLTEASPELFAPDYVDAFPNASLPPANNARKVIKIKNDSKIIHLEPNVENQPRMGLSSLSSDVLCDVKSEHSTIFAGETVTFEISYHEDDASSELDQHKADPSPITLRFGVRESREVVDFLEVTLSGSGLSNVTSVFKRATIDAAGTPSIVDLAGTFVRHPDPGLIVIPPAAELEQR